jgi:hypothetical protein
VRDKRERVIFAAACWDLWCHLHVEFVPMGLEGNTVACQVLVTTHDILD